MKALILAAGRGERMRPLTDTIPKPLLTAGGKTLIARLIEQLVNAGFSNLVINHAHLGYQIEHALGEGHAFGANIVYSAEQENGLETAGGIIQALPLLGEKFLVVNGDIATDFPFEILKNGLICSNLAHLILVNNPPHHVNGDFGIQSDGMLTNQQENRFTFSGISVYHKDFFKNLPLTRCKLAPLLRQAIDKQQVSGQKFEGFWSDIGTPERLAILNNYYETV